ncbi:MAG TPA: Txe/YoeB family addiction module toxin [Prosthecobacter sp.]|jgi:toxin YoeB|nr:Txe/YoeB family addiction module toxin [Prosthecobacter sp.]
MKLTFSDRAWSEYQHWQETDRRMLRRVNELLKDIKRSPFNGIGKPEPLRHQYAGFWSRRIDGEHRLVYSVTQSNIEIASCRYHYT